MSLIRLRDSLQIVDERGVFFQDDSIFGHRDAFLSNRLAEGRDDLI